MMTKKFVVSSCIAILVGLAVAVVGISGGYLGGYDQQARNNLITVIEDRTSEPAGFMVMTADYNYAIYSPRLAEFKWQSVTVNGAQVFIVTKENATLITGLFSLNELERDFIAEVRSGFTQNLAGLKLTYSSSDNKPHYSHMNSGELSYASAAINLIKGVSYLAGAQRFAERNIDENHFENEIGHDKPGHKLVAPEDTPLAELAKLNQQKNLDPTSVKEDAKSERSDGQSLTKRSYLASNNGNIYARPQYQQQQPFGPQYSFVPAYQPAKYNQNSYCTRKSFANFNYYNLHHSHLTNSLCGDIYNFDMRCNILDVYSESVSILQQTGVSVLYRDHHYFAYSRSGLPLQINRFFLVGERVFFVYNDGSMLLKQNWLLEPTELDIVVGARRQLRAASSWQTKPVEVNESGAGQKEAESEDKKRQLTNNEQRSSGQDDKKDGKKASSEKASGSSNTTVKQAVTDKQ